MMYMSTSLLVLKENRIAGVKWSIVRSIVHSIQVVGICLRMLQFHYFDLKCMLA